ncbi:MAG: Ribosome-binding factor A [uncultured bacterium]|nr:MAG: Ribosome-binding factor A [uncultured bacterium]HBR71876.1 hypothetical protein [Candidatus Moranbacteria bacterium]
MSQRIEKINSLIRKHISEILIKEVSFKPGVFLTIPKVDTTPDLRYTRVFLSIFPEKETAYVVATIKKETYALQGSLNKRLQMKPLPQLVFKVDTTEAAADKIEKILLEI